VGKIGYSFRLLKEFWGFARTHKAYWIVPLVIILGLVTILIFSTQAVTPFIYSLF
jgi:hypothetical protein